MTDQSLPTPRTDAVLTKYRKYGLCDTYNAMLDNARQLERENAALRKALESVDSYYSGSLDHQPPYVAIARAALKEPQ